MEKVDLKMRNVVFFDGVCHLCNGFVDAVISRDKTHFFLFAPLQGVTAEKLLSPADRTNLDTVIYFEKGRIYRRSAAVLRILSGLGGAYRIFALARIIPGPLRDLLYNYVAKNRYHWFGEREFCRLPTPQERSYLLP
ncbi:MAG: thiol-disulfide oxidoreductase [Bdellovibrio sp. ArHS]|uniref:thiol-disulfide oxidoreductase DCC family protein n=1 Tax=Bdellovibrio sp. ArHS TaxID=1569284 RepID=UPI0005831140|nr:DCC1-like thiol-disulfide oxidoreductase family protein [Bdellovibrio sp. ArHS]KHD89632.1 MAG: thiol-disulfide oxidoreductase [Bdellovibrio sp. ArHS]